MEFDSAYLYIKTATSKLEKIAKIDAIIEALEDVALQAAESENITEYSLDDGQTKIRTVYRSALSVHASIEAFERMKQRYINQLNGRMVRLVDSKSFKS